MISSDNEELPQVCDKVLIMSEGRIVGTLNGTEITKEAILYKSFEHVPHHGDSKLVLQRFEAL